MYREGNKLADHMANYALDIGIIECHGYCQFDIQGRRFVNDDKSQCPYLSVKVARIHEGRKYIPSPVTNP